MLLAKTAPWVRNSIMKGCTHMVKWDAWHDQRMNRNRFEREQEEELVRGQRRRLEAQLARQQGRERLESLENALQGLTSRLDAQQEIDALLKAASTTERRQLIARICQEVQTRYGHKPMQDPFPADLIGLLRLLSRYGHEPAEPGSQRAASLQLQDLSLSGLRLDALDWRGAIIRNSRFEAARLPGANLFAARLEQVALTGADLSGANLTGATLIKADLSGSKLNKAELIRAELLDCNLRGADLRDASLRGVRLSGSDLGGADLSTARDLTYQQLLGCRIDDQTRLPANLAHRRESLLSKISAP